ncbi:MAG TPA: hypothetical protein VG097_08360 [Gemmata sp.]|nr:hypothetical protein [Gemmata sp.]
MWPRAEDIGYYDIITPEDRTMSIELTADQAQVVAAEGEQVVVIDPRTKQVYRLVREEVFRQVEAILYDASPWTPNETGILAGRAFGKLDDTDYSEYLRDDA